ncbi:MAG: hypothetical protein A2X49_08075 [Lentisphaerae bacterium GWF2_52_8]|nr:MAG: hypothetical protein A2X49_08075 [Lentisphaerae bacterium GWF2_52_8]
MEHCPCGSGISLQECCQPLIKGERKARTALELLRSRYTAYAKAEVDYVLATTHPSQRNEGDEKTVRDWAKSATWHGLEIVEADAGNEGDSEGKIEFIARYTEKNIPQEHHELALFKKEEGEWFFYDARILPHKPFIRTQPKIGRNEPCSCGSGKKYKKCCGK